MPIFYVPSEANAFSLQANQQVSLDKAESHHALRVLRLQQGDAVTLLDGAGHTARGCITDATSKQCVVAIESVETYPPPRRPIHLAVAPPKARDRLELLLEKVTELEVQEITLLLTARSERRRVRTDRCRKVIREAMKQSANPYLPRLHTLTPFSTFIRQMETDTSGTRLFGYCGTALPRRTLQALRPKLGPVVLLIGPEGDFTPEEAQQAGRAGFEALQLARTRLRTETAAIVACYGLQMLTSK